MKDKENIKNVNKLSMSYMLLMGLQGKRLEPSNPFLNFLYYKMLINGAKNNDTLDKITFVIDKEEDDHLIIEMIPNELVHGMIEESIIMYKLLNEGMIKESEMDEKISSYLQDDYSGFVEKLELKFKNSLLSILLNYNSMVTSYNEIKIDIFNDEMNECVKSEDYDNAIIFRDRIKETKERILYTKKESGN